MFKRLFLVVLDSVGIGNADDSFLFGDFGAHTLKSVMSVDPDLPNLKKSGLFNIARAGLTEYSDVSPDSIYASLSEKSNGKDTTVGHWEIAGVISKRPFPTYKNGFPKEIIDEFCKENNVEILCNLPYSGTEVIKDYGDEHVRTGKPIIYTSADSVFQIACHEDIVPLDKLYEMCESARRILKGEHAVGRVIARPFKGENGKYYRTGGRHDYSLSPTGVTMLDLLKENNYDVISIGKIYDIFASRGATESIKTKSNTEGESALLDIQKRDFCGLCFVNLVDFDMVYGHRNDVQGYANALMQFDKALGIFKQNMLDTDLLIITADHGCDPMFEGTDHTRENVPLIVYHNRCEPADLGHIHGFDCIAATVCENFDIKHEFNAKSFIDTRKGAQNNA